MDNNYFTQVAPYMQQLSPQDQAGLNPVFQNMAAQQANQNAALQQQMQNNQVAGQTKGSSGSMNPMTMANMLRQTGGASPMDRAAAYLGTSNTPQMQAQVNQLGSNTWNPMSDYNLGKNGWGSYGE
jgi:hypothetical protein